MMILLSSPDSARLSPFLHLSSFTPNPSLLCILMPASPLPSSLLLFPRFFLFFLLSAPVIFLLKCCSVNNNTYHVLCMTIFNVNVSLLDSVPTLMHMVFSKHVHQVTLSNLSFLLYPTFLPSLTHLV